MLLLREVVYTPKCHLHPEKCKIENVFLPDQLLLPKKLDTANNTSDLTQNITIAIGLSAPVLIYSGLSLLKNIHPTVALTWLGTDLLLITQTLLWNSFGNEIV